VKSLNFSDSNGGTHTLLCCATLGTFMCQFLPTYCKLMQLTKQFSACNLIIVILLDGLFMMSGDEALEEEKGKRVICVSFSISPQRHGCLYF